MNNFNKGQFTRAKFIDIKAAYDNVNIHLLYEKLISFEIPINLVNAIFQLLSKKIIYVKDNKGILHGPPNI